MNINKPMYYVLGLFVLLAVLMVNTNRVDAAEPCSEVELLQLQIVTGQDIPARDAKYPVVPEPFTSIVNETNGMDSAVGGYINGDLGQSVHFYLPDELYGRCALLFSRNSDGVVSWGAERLGKHAAWGGERVFVPSSYKDAVNGYYVYVIDETPDSGELYPFNLVEYVAESPQWTMR